MVRKATKAVAEIPKARRTIEENVKFVKIFPQVSFITGQKFAFPVGPFFADWHKTVKCQIPKDAIDSHPKWENAR